MQVVDSPNAFQADLQQCLLCLPEKTIPTALTCTGTPTVRPAMHRQARVDCDFARLLESGAGHFGSKRPNCTASVRRQRTMHHPPQDICTGFGNVPHKLRSTQDTFRPAGALYSCMS